MNNDSLGDSNVERLPPQSIDSEQAILGALLVNPETMSKVVDQLEPDNFYRKAHQVIYAAILDLYEKTEPIDIVTLSQYLKDQGKLDSVGGRQYLTDLALSIATTANAEYYAKTVAEKALLRNLIKAGTEIVASCYEDNDADVVVDKAEQMIFSIAQRRSMGALTHIKDVVNDSFARIEKRYEQRDALSGVPTGFYDLDEMTSGWQPSDLIILAARPSMGKCLAFDSEILLNDGSIATIEEIYRRSSANLLTLGNDYQLSWTQPTVFVDDGIKPVFKVTTRLGRTIETTITHPFLTIDGWKKLGEIGTGTAIAVPRRLPVEGNSVMRDCEVKLLAYLLGDGCTSHGKISFTNNNVLIQSDFLQSVDEFGELSARVEPPRGRATTLVVRKDLGEIRTNRSKFANELKRTLSETMASSARLAEALGVTKSTITHWKQGSAGPGLEARKRIEELFGLSSSSNVRWCSESKLEQWLKSIGVHGKRASEKSIPRCVFTLNSQQLAVFLNRLFSTDGWASVFKTGQSQIGYCSVSEKLARQVQHLLLRFGIIAKLKKKSVRYRDSVRFAWQVEITDHLSLVRFVDDIGIIGKEAAVLAVRNSLADRKMQTNRDLIPIEIWKDMSLAKGTASWASVGAKMGSASSNLHVGRRAPTRAKLYNFAVAVQSERLSQLAQSDVYWDEIVSIEYAGDKQVYDLTVPDTHNFVANDICVHNTAFCLNLAQHAAVEAKAPVALFSLEMSKEQLVQRLLCAEAKIDANKLRTGFLQSSDWQNLASAMGRLGEAPIFIDDSAAVTAMDVRAKCRRLKSEMKGLGLIIIDYIQLMSGRAKSDGNRVQEISEISRGLKQLARELNVPVIALSQLSRAVEARQNKRPMLSDLRESGAIEQDADIVMFIYRDEYYNPESEKRGEAEIIIAKQRNGPVGSVELLYQASITRFLNKAVQNQYAQV